MQMNRLLLAILITSLSATSALAVCDVRVGRVVDGDTFYSPTLRVASPTQYRVEDTRFRLYQVFAPERGEPRYQEATNDLRALIADRFVSITILPERDPRGGLIVEVFTCDDAGEKSSANQAMRSKGWTEFGRGVK